MSNTIDLPKVQYNILQLIDAYTTAEAAAVEHHYAIIGHRPAAARVYDLTRAKAGERATQAQARLAYALHPDEHDAQAFLLRITRACTDARARVLREDLIETAQACLAAYAPPPVVVDLLEAERADAQATMTVIRAADLETSEPDPYAVAVEAARRATAAQLRDELEAATRPSTCRNGHPVDADGICEAWCDRRPRMPGTPAACRPAIVVRQPLPDLDPKAVAMRAARRAKMGWTP